MLLFILAPLALAGELWVGGGVGASAGIFPGAQDINGQVELDVRWKNELLYARLDLDANYYFAEGEHSWLVPPEWAMLQIGREGPFARVGIHNPNVGLEDWDAWNNYLPSFSLAFNYMQPGRLLGVEAGWHFDDGTEVVLYGGSDIDWEGYATPTLLTGAWISAEKDLFSTWSGVQAYPTEATYALVGALELYPHDLVWVTFDGGAGLVEGTPWAGGGVILNVLPEATVVPSARVEGVYDPDGVLGAPVKGTASVALRAYPTDFITLQLEGKALLADEVSPGVYAAVWFNRPDMPYYDLPSVEEEEEAAPPEAAPPAPAPPAPAPPEAAPPAESPAPAPPGE